MSDPAQLIAGRRILVVEDEYLIAMEVARWLQGAGVIVLGPVPSVDQALDLIEDGGVDAAILDINLGDGDTVYPVADALDALGVPYLFATGDVTLADSSHRRHRPTLVKPYRATDLLRALTGLAAAP